MPAPAGRFAARLLRVNSPIEVDAVDAARRCSGRFCGAAGPHAGRVRAHCADLRLWRPAGPSYDLVVTRFLLDFLTDAEGRALAVILRGALCPSGLWAVSEFAIPEAGFRLSCRRSRLAGLLTGELWLLNQAESSLYFRLCGAPNGVRVADQGTPKGGSVVSK